MVREILGQYVGPYRLLELIAVGGSSQIYRAAMYDSDPQSEVALKVLSAEVRDDPYWRLRFEREVEIGRRLRHVSVLPVLDYGIDQGRMFLVMPLAPRGTLADLLKERGALSPEATVDVAQQIGQALDYVHAHNIIHRDVKPSNIMLMDRGTVCLADFGRGKFFKGSDPITHTGYVVGAPAYMSPEQAGSLPLDRRSDIYSFGVVLYECLLGRVPFNADSDREMIQQQTRALPFDPRDINPEFPSELGAVLLRALSKELKDRYQFAGELSEALAGSLDTLPDSRRIVPLVTRSQVAASNQLVNPSPRGRSVRTQAGPRQSWAAFAGIALALALLVAALSAFVFQPLRSRVVDAEATANAFRMQTPIVITQIVQEVVTNPAGRPQIIEVTRIVTMFPPTSTPPVLATRNPFGFLSGPEPGEALASPSPTSTSPPPTSTHAPPPPSRGDDERGDKPKPNSGGGTGSGGTASGSTTAGTTSGDAASGDTSGDTTGGTTTGDTTGGDTSGDTTGGTTAGDTTGGDTSGATTGGTTAGDTTGVDTAGDATGGTTAGDSTGGATSGDTTGGTTAGDTTGGATAGDSTGGSTAGDTTGGDTAGSPSGGDTGAGETGGSAEP